MCGRYELHANPAAIALAFGLVHPPAIAPRYNIAPTQLVPIVRLNAQGERELVQVRWGLVPRFARQPSIGARFVNARGETVATKLGTAFRRHRCLLPADAFYEWYQRADGTKQPMRVAMNDGSLLGLAGVYDRWLSPDGEPLDSCTIVTTTANALVAPVHDRMPVIVPREAYGDWLDPATPDAQALIRPFDASAMSYRAVSTRVNNVRNDDPGCIEPIDADEPLPPVQAELPVDDAPHDSPDEPSDEPSAKPVQSELF